MGSMNAMESRTFGSRGTGNPDRCREYLLTDRVAERLFLRTMTEYDKIDARRPQPNYWHGRPISKDSYRVQTWLIWSVVDGRAMYMRLPLITAARLEEWGWSIVSAPLRKHRLDRARALRENVGIN